MQTDVRAEGQTDALAQLRDGNPGSTTRLGDATAVFLVLRQALRGIGGVISLAVIVIAFGALAHALNRIAARALSKVRLRRPSPLGTVVLITLAGEPLRRVAGLRAAGTPSPAPIMALSLLVLGFRRIVPSVAIIEGAYRAVRHALSLDPPPK
jgi:hypothetical protein